MNAAGWLISPENQLSRKIGDEKGSRGGESAPGHEKVTKVT